MEVWSEKFRFPFEAASGLYSVFRTHWQTLSKIRYTLMRELRVSLSDFGNMMFSECVELFEYLNEDGKKQAEREKQATGDGSINYAIG